MHIFSVIGSMQVRSAGQPQAKALFSTFCFGLLFVGALCATLGQPLSLCMLMYSILMAMPWPTKGSPEDANMPPSPTMPPLTIAIPGVTLPWSQMVAVCVWTSVLNH